MTTLAINKATYTNSNETANKESISFICFHSNNELDGFKQRLDHINNDFIFYTELESCINFIQSIRKQKIFLIIPFSQLNYFDQIENIFMFCLDKNQNEYSSLQNSKVIGVFDNVDLLCSSIQEQINYIEKQSRTWCFIDQNEYATRDLTKQASDFLWLQLFHDVLLHLPFEKQVKIQNGHHYYRQHVEELKALDEFEKNHESKDALHWFIENSSLQNMINKALQTENTNLLYTLRYFMADLLNNLSQKHQQIMQSDREKLIVYRQMKLSKDEFKQLLNKKGKLLSMKGFLIAHTDRSSASIEQTHLISVLFEIECNVKELGNDLIFVDITQFTQSSSQETILFDFNATFRLEEIQQKEGILVIKLIAVNDGRYILRKYIEDTHRQIEDLSIPIMFGKLLCDMSEWNQSQEYFQRLMNNSPNEDRAWIEHSIGQAHQWKGEWDKARWYYDRVYDQMMQHEPIRIKDSAIVLSDIGEILYVQGKYEECLDFHQRALTIRKQYYSSNHPHIATSLRNIGLVQFQRQKDDEALILFKEALTIQEEYYNHFHVNIGIILSNIGSILASQENYEEALEYHQRAMSMYEKYYPSGHIHIATALNRIGSIFRRQEKYDESLNVIQQALTIQKKFYPFGNVDIATSICNIGRISHRLTKYDESLELCQHALTIERKYYSSDHLDIVCTLNMIGYVQLYGKENYDEALHYHQQALQILERSYPSYHGNIAMVLYYIGNISKKQKKYDEALNILHRALKMQEDYYLSDQIDMTVVLNNISKILVDQEKYDEAVGHLQRTLTIRKKYNPPYHVNIVIDLETIGDIRLKQRKMNDALDCYQQALVILEQYHPTNYEKIINCLEALACVFFHKSLYANSAEYFERCLRISEANLPLGHSSIIRTLSNLGLVQRIQGEYGLVLLYELKCFSLREKFLPPNHSNIGKSLSIIAGCYERLNQMKIALEYYKQALNVYERCLPFQNEDHENTVVKIKQLSEKIQ